MDVTGMHCPSCEMLIKDLLEELNGVRSAAASLKTGKVVVEFDETKISNVAIKKVIRGMDYAVK
jgi:Cu+-exporting ATPase